MIDAMTLRSIRSADNDTLNAMIKEINSRRSALQKEIGSTFAVGQNVEFTGKRGETVRGMILKINRKTIIVKTHFVKKGKDHSNTWRVSPSLLRKA